MEHHKNAHRLFLVILKKVKDLGTRKEYLYVKRDQGTLTGNGVLRFT